NAALVERAGRVTAEEVRTTGFHWVFAPCITVPQDIRWGRTYEGFGETPDIVKPLGEAAVRGLQGHDVKDPLAVMTSSKHAAGDGGTVFGTGLKGLMDHGDVKLDEA